MYTDSVVHISVINQAFQWRQSGEMHDGGHEASHGVTVDMQRSEHAPAQIIAHYFKLEHLPHL